MTQYMVWYDNGGNPHNIPIPEWDTSLSESSRFWSRPLAPTPTPPPQVAPTTPPIAPAPSPIDPAEFAAILYDKLIPIGLSTRATWGGRIIEGPVFGTIGGESVASFIAGYYIPINYWDEGTRQITELLIRGQLAWTASGGSLLSGLNVNVPTSNSQQMVRFNIGTLTQSPDAWSVSRLGIERASAYIPLVTATFENFRLAQFGNLVPFTSVTVEDTAFGAAGDLVAWADAIEALARYDGRDASEFEAIDVSGGLMALVLGNRINFTDFLSGMRHHKPHWNIRTADKLYLVEKGVFSLDVTLQRERLLRRGAQPIVIHSRDAFDSPREKVAKFLDFDRDYEPSNVTVSESIDPVIATDSFETDTYDVPIASTSNVMMAETAFAYYTEEMAREKSEWSGMAHMLGLDAGDCYKWVSGSGRELFHRVNELVRKPDFTVDVKGEGFLTCAIEDAPPEPPDVNAAYPVVTFSNTGLSHTANFGASSFAFPVPSGFSSSVNTWNPADKSANISLTGGNLTASASSASVGGVRGHVITGKYYFEVTCAGTVADSGVGLATLAADLTGPSRIAGVNVANGAVFMGTIFYYYISTAFVSGDIVCVAADLPNNTIWFRKNGDLWNNSSTADPATNTGGINMMWVFPVASVLARQGS